MLPSLLCFTLYTHFADSTSLSVSLLTIFFGQTDALHQFIMVALLPIYRGVSYPSRYMQPGCQLRTTSEWSLLNLTLHGVPPMSNISCPLGPCVPAAITCLSAVQALWLTKPHHTTTSILSTNAIHFKQHFM